MVASTLSRAMLVRKRLEVCSISDLEIRGGAAYSGFLECVSISQVVRLSAS